MSYQYTDRIPRTKSTSLFEEAKKLFPGGVNSPVRAFKAVSGAPLFIKKGDGCRIWDEDDNVYIDFCNSWGPLILGHNNAEIREAIMKTVMDGTSFGTPTKYGIEIGKLIIENHRFLEKIRFVSSGTEAVMSAIRLARGYTGRSKILKFEGCYHGHVDSLMVKAGSGLATLGVSTSAGIPEEFANETIVVPLNDLATFIDTMKEFDGQIAAVIIEPIPANNGLLLQDHNYLSWVRKVCDDHNVLLIFDEVISGFRVGFEGAAGYYNIEPDLITFGKIIGGGMPVGAFGGRADIMSMIAPDGPVYQAGTLSGNPVTLSAGIAALKVLMQKGFYEGLESKTQKIKNELNAFCEKNKLTMRIEAIASIFWLNFAGERVFSSDEISADSSGRFKIIHHELLQRGIYLGPSSYEVGFVSAAHKDDDINYFIEQMMETITIAYAS
jgi:glutamate-1-semialdehyde 2,1-aminomutase